MTAINDADGLYIGASKLRRAFYGGFLVWEGFDPELVRATAAGNEDTWEAAGMGVLEAGDGEVASVASEDAVPNRSSKLDTIDLIDLSDFGVLTISVFGQEQHGFLASVRDSSGSAVVDTGDSAILIPDVVTLDVSGLSGPHGIRIEGITSSGGLIVQGTVRVDSVLLA